MKIENECPECGGLLSITGNCLDQSCGRKNPMPDVERMKSFVGMYQTFEIGETCHIFTPNHKGNTTEGKVVKEIEISPGNNQYVIEVDVGIDCMYYVRNGFMLGMRKTPVVPEPAEPLVIDPGYYWVKVSQEAKKQIMEYNEFGWFKIGAWKSVDNVQIVSRIYNYSND